MKVLLDTCVISELRHPKGQRRVREAVESLASDNLFVSVITTGELAKGINLLRETERKETLQQWLFALERSYADRILAIDLDTSNIWGEITAAAQRAGKVIPATDGLIAATALRHGLHLMTRNTAHFAATGVLLLNPWQS